ncbi:PAS domain S-box-containing protein/diguanylate cyclase (GGDEF)-like protein [Micromonospora pisi]|uniref:PAS domain S-box-containing protein/diguanylate cyclase (GGDEF)-like protein n=1 Tax=Micromonospora pisi TaxID=589240 RepID=A0A495JQI2_9ACTN|nr:PAS domain S-box-containing protein/diguanylate cyclase (GGDEF)-like protein [Micromonospora pisi]
MSVALPPRAGSHRRTTQVPEIVAGSAAAVILIAGSTGLLSTYLALAVAVGVVSALAATRLIRLALVIHAARRSFGPCRGVGFLGAGVVASGSTVLALALVSATVRPLLLLLGLLVALPLYLLGVLLLPGAASTVSMRLRRGFDGLSLGVSLAFVGWLMPPAGGMPPVALAVALLAAGGLSIIAVTALRSFGYRRAAGLCGAGAGASVLGLAVLGVLLTYDVPGWAPLGAAVPLVVGPILAAAGTRYANPGAQPPPPGEPETHLSAYPLLTVPAVVATLAAVYHLVVVGEFDHTSIVLGLAVIPTLVVREVFAVLDIRSYARRLVSQEAHFRALVTGANDLTLVVGADLLVRWQSPAAARLFGLADADVVGRAFADLMHPDDAASVTELLTGVLTGPASATGRSPLVTARLRDGHGMWRDTESTVSDQRGVPEVDALVVHVRDVGERRKLEHQVHQLSFTDQLTGLANRRDLMRAIVTQRSLAGHTGSLLVVDLHGMSAINESRGREVGDAVLVEVGRRLRTGAGGDDVVARLGGDEFAVVTVDGPMLAYALGIRLIGALTEPYQLPGAIVSLQASIGLAELCGGSGVDDVLRRAEMARRRAQQLGRNRIEWYDSDLEEQLVRRMDLERELPGAAMRGEFDLVYQPVLGLHDKRPVGTEALVRWRSPSLGTVLPAELVPVAEDLGLIDELGQWVLHKACRQLAEWSRGGRQLWMSVNVSVTELTGSEFVGRVAAALTIHQVEPDRLLIEIAEPSGEVDIMGVVGQLGRLRALGVRTALDDFGLGPASLAHLRRMPVDILKINRSLVSDPSGWQGQGKPVIDVVVSLGRRLGMEIVAEGLESADQVEQARLAGCRFGQGFVLARPATAERVEAYLEEFPSPSR